jgi:hypothetical protein
MPSPTGSAEAKNNLAESVVQQIMDDPEMEMTDNGPTVDYRLPDGRGIRFHGNGEFKGFLDED